MGKTWRFLVVSSISFLLLGFSAASASADQGPAGIRECNSVGDVLTQGDGKSVVFAATGNCRNWTMVGWKNVALRLDGDGNRDLTFGGDGLVTIGDESVRDTALTPDDGLLVATASRILKFDSDGKADEGFGSDGSITFSTSRLAVSSDGRIAVTQVLDYGTGFNNAGKVLILRPDGLPDPEFNGGNPLAPMVELPGRPDPEARDSGPVNFAEDGGLFGTYFYDRAEPDPEGNRSGVGIGVFKLESNGELDQSFGGGDGSAPVANSEPVPGELGRNWKLWQLNQLDDGSVQVNGDLTTNADFIYSLAQPASVLMTADGSSSSFGSLDAHGTMEALDSAVSGDGTITIAEYPTTYRGEPANPHEGEFAVGRFSRDRNPDQGFGDNGYTGLKLGAPARSGAVALTADDGVTAAGILDSGVCPEEGCRKPIIIARFDSAGELVGSFGDCGVVSIPKVRWDRSSDPSQFQCTNSPLPKPKVTAGLFKKNAGRLLRVGIVPSTRNPDRTRPWQRTTLKVPPRLRLKAGRHRAFKVYAGKVDPSNRVKKKFVTYRKSGLLTIGNPAGESWKPLRVEVSLSSIKRRGKGMAGRIVRFKAAYSADGAKKTVGYGRLRVRR